MRCASITVALRAFRLVWSRGTIDHAALVPLPGADLAAISEPSSSPAGGAKPIASVDGKMVWRSSPRWAAVKSDAKIEGNPN